MRDEEWQGLDEEALGRLLVERWLYRGLILGVILIAAITATYLGTRGVATVMEWLTVSALLALALAAGAFAFGMRQQDLRIQEELRRRRRGSPRA